MDTPRRIKVSIQVDGDEVVLAHRTWTFFRALRSAQRWSAQLRSTGMCQPRKRVFHAPADTPVQVGGEPPTNGGVAWALV